LSRISNLKKETRTLVLKPGTVGIFLIPGICQPGNLSGIAFKKNTGSRHPPRKITGTALLRSQYVYRYSDRKAIVLRCSTLWYNLKGGERKMFDWNLFLTIIIAILKAIISALPAV
jgi:hypothetical protein